MIKDSVRLVNTQGGHNKYYEMQDNGDGSMTAFYGRIGSQPSTAHYGIDMWDRKYSEKLKKGYVDETAKGLVFASTAARNPAAAKQNTQAASSHHVEQFSPTWKDSDRYELTGETKIIPQGITSVKLWRIRSLRDFVCADGTDVFSGDLGGWLQYPGCLVDNAWVAGEAIVMGHAVVMDNALVTGNAMLTDNSCVSGFAIVKDDAHVCEDAVVSGNAVVFGKAVIAGRTEVKDRAWVGDGAWIQGNVVIKDDAWVGGCSDVTDNRVIGGTAYLDK